MDPHPAGVLPMPGRQRIPGQLSALAVLCLVFLPYALGHYLSCLLRNVNAILAPQLVSALALSPGQLGLLTSAYFFSFAFAQLPVGLALDRFGPRRVQSAMLLLAAIGTFAFAGSSSFTQLIWARGIMGLGLAGCFMAALKAISTWIAPARLPSVQGYLIAAGGLGAASATLPVRLALHHMDWRWVFIWLAGACILVSLLIWLLSPTPPAAQPKPFHRRMVLEICSHASFREVAALVLIPHTVFFGVQGLWIGRWLTDVAKLGEQSVAWLLYLSMAAVIFGAIAVGMITEWAGRRGIPPLTVAGVGVSLFIIVQTGFVLGWAPGFPMLSVLFTLVGTITGIEYAIVTQSMPSTLTGRASTCLNLLIFLGAFLVQAGFGQVIGMWQPDSMNRYPAAAYQTAFGILIAAQFPGLCWFVMRQRRRLRGTL
ncbi:MFS transporter [Massilia endophytica]|uniref:MFS transporter n=1 Tax=Massilia endophytica TaxID=2899220 RepID=UPI001E3ED844|nr:MFS transporter [Massilia endophytica]UGQ45726.1 MFS transporter [Massilia endophytica]